MRWFTNFLPSPLDRHPPHAHTHSQLLSALPLEIRCQIYADVLHSYGTVQHVVLSNSKLTRMRCASPNSHAYFQHFSARHGVCEAYDPAYQKSMQNCLEILPLFLSCRQTYLEFIEIIYSSTTFRLPTWIAAKLIATAPAPDMVLAHLHLSFDVTNPMYLPPRAWPIGFSAVWEGEGRSGKG